jgi:hypothetical protein
MIQTILKIKGKFNFMNPAIACLNHNAIPHYQSIDRSKATYCDKSLIDTTNKNLLNLTPQGRVVAQTI